MKNCIDFDLKSKKSTVGILRKDKKSRNETMTMFDFTSFIILEKKLLPTTKDKTLVVGKMKTKESIFIFIFPTNDSGIFSITKSNFKLMVSL